MAIPSVGRSTTKAAAWSITVGPTGVADIFSKLRKYDQTNRIVSMSRSYAPLLTLITAKLSRLKVTDPEPRIWLDAPHEGVFTPNASQSTAYWTLDMGTTNIRFFQAGDILSVIGMFYRASATVNAADWDAVRGSNNNDSKAIYMPETLLVTDVDYTAGLLTVLRGDGTDSTICDTAITTSMKVIKKGNANAENSGSPPAISVQPMYDDNYCEIFKKAWGMSNTELGSQTWIGSGQQELQRRAVSRRNEMAREMEVALLFGHKARYYNASNMMVRTTGGILELIESQSGLLGDGLNKVFDLGDSNLSISGPYTSGGIMQLAEKIFTYGNQNKFCGVGQSFVTEFNSLFPDKMRVNQELSSKLGLDVTDFVTGHGVLTFVHTPVLTLMGGSGADQDFNRQFAVIDLEFINMMEFRPITVEQNIQGNDVDGVKHQLLGEIGWWRAFPDAHSYVYGIAESA